MSWRMGATPTPWHHLEPLKSTVIQKLRECTSLVGGVWRFCQMIFMTTVWDVRWVGIPGIGGKLGLKASCILLSKLGILLEEGTSF